MYFCVFMHYSELVALYEKLESTSKQLEKIFLLSTFLKNIPTKDLSHTLLLLQGRVFPTWDERKIGIAAKLVLKSLNVATGITVEALEKQWKEIGDLGEVARHVVTKKKQATLFTQQLMVEKVFKNIQKLATLEGTGTVDFKTKLIAELLSSATPVEAKYIIRTLLEDLRVGVGEGVLRESVLLSYFPPLQGLYFQCKKCDAIMPKVEQCFTCGHEFVTKFSSLEPKNGLLVKKPEVLLSVDLSGYHWLYFETVEDARATYNYLSNILEHAYHLKNDFGEVLVILREQGLQGLAKLDIELFKPIRLMLYEKAKDIPAAFEKVGKPAAFEYKYDGFRLEIHKHGDKVCLFTRNFENVTAQFPDVVAVVKQQVSADRVILDSETVGYNPKTTQYVAFQVVSQRIKRKYNIKELAAQFPVEVNVFDVLYHGHKSVLDLPFHERRALLSKIVHPVARKIVLSRIMITDKVDEARKFYDEALDKGNEGIMVKNLEAVYQPGKRVGFGVKVKPVMESLDLAIVGAEWGTGKRASWLTSFTVACRDENGEFVELGNVGTGIKELEGEGVTFSYLTKMLQQYIVEEKGKLVRITPAVVIEINYEEIQKSPGYSSGYALRFPRLLRLREDRGVHDCSTLQQVEELYREQRGRGK